MNTNLVSSHNTCLAEVIGRFSNVIFTMSIIDKFFLPKLQIYTVPILIQ
ncbi:hypothetical protein L248_3091 [Schleiferilactobacillus shenzhenensis LY-73]|uniref:Uncharacterized protein n=1 Tax=Schleiferilactobacillus shenzhenensis LY-73 TaxID=1231336 RepID=U4TTE2_9LACO|nr:hypothetical protein L248_3091 [Schleiferilactobacillus shenzhenensis LY-73]